MKKIWVALPALVFGAGLAMPSRGDDQTAATQKALDAFRGLNLRHIMPYPYSPATRRVK